MKRAILGMLSLLAAAPAAGQVNTGDTVEVLGRTFEVVSFDVRSLAETGDVYELRFPAPLQEYSEEDWSQTDLRAWLMVYRPGRVLCIGETEQEISGYPAFVSGPTQEWGGAPVYMLGHMYYATPDEVLRSSYLYYGRDLQISILLDADTCVHAGLSGDTGAFRGGHTNDEAERGINRLAGEHAPSVAELEAIDVELRKLLAYIDIRRVR